jgi:hypothetical protein
MGVKGLFFTIDKYWYHRERQKHWQHKPPLRQLDRSHGMEGRRVWFQFPTSGSHFSSHGNDYFQSYKRPLNDLPAQQVSRHIVLTTHNHPVPKVKKQWSNTCRRRPRLVPAAVTTRNVFTVIFMNLEAAFPHVLVICFGWSSFMVGRHALMDVGSVCVCVGGGGTYRVRHSSWWYCTWWRWRIVILDISLCWIYYKIVINYHQHK